MYKMIIADDEAVICTGLQKAIDWAGLGIKVVATAEDGLTALDQFKRHRPHIVLADINMPGLDGLSLLSEIKQLDPETVVIFISAHSKFAYAQRAIQLGAFNYLIKPFSEEDLITTVKQAISVLKERESVRRMLKQASIAQEQYSRDIMLSGIRGLLPVKESTLRLLARDIHMDPAACDCFGVLLKTLHPSGEDFVPASFTGIRAYAMALVKEHPTAFHILMFATAPGELLAMFFFAPDRRSLADKLCAGFLQNAFEQSAALQGGVSAKHAAQEGFSKVYAECCAALAARAGKAPQARMFRYEQLFAPPCPPDISQDAFSGLVFDACANEQRNKLPALCFQMLLQLCRSGRLYRLIDSYMAMISGVRQVLDRLEIQLAGSSESAKTAEIEEQLRTQPQTSIFDCYAFCLKMLYAIYDIYQENLRVSNHIVKDALSYIQQNYSRAISLAQLSEQLLITPNYLSRLFKEKTGNSFTDHVTLQRIEAAKSMLRSGQLKVYEVAEKVGYSDQQYFAKQFKKLTGVTPTQYANGTRH